MAPHTNWQVPPTARPSIQWLTIHCSATHAGQDIDAAEIRRWHQAKGWQDIGYHWVIKRDGTLEIGRPAEQTGAHVYGHNPGNLGICLIGGCDKQLQPQDNFTLAQRKTLFTLIAELQARYALTDEQVKPHHAWSSHKACPVINLHATDFATHQTGSNT